MKAVDAFNVFVRALGLWFATSSLITLIFILWQSPPWNGAEVSTFISPTLSLLAGAIFLARGDLIARAVFGSPSDD